MRESAPWLWTAPPTTAKGLTPVSALLSNCSRDWPTYVSPTYFVNPIHVGFLSLLDEAGSPAQSEERRDSICLHLESEARNDKGRTVARHIGQLCNYRDLGVSFSKLPSGADPSGQLC